MARESLTVIFWSNCECFHCHTFQNENDSANFDLSYFNGKEVYIDLARKHKHLEPILKKALTKTGATIEFFFSKDVDCIITDRLHSVTSHSGTSPSGSTASKISMASGSGTTNILLAAQKF